MPISRTTSTSVILIRILIPILIPILILVRVTLHLRIANPMVKGSCYRGGIVHIRFGFPRARSVWRPRPKALSEPIEAAQAAVRLLFACLLFLLLSSSSSSSSF